MPPTTSRDRNDPAILASFPNKRLSTQKSPESRPRLVRGPRNCVKKSAPAVTATESLDDETLRRPITHRSRIPFGRLAGEGGFTPAEPRTEPRGGRSSEDNSEGFRERRPASSERSERAWGTEAISAKSSLIPSFVVQCFLSCFFFLIISCESLRCFCFCSGSQSNFVSVS